MVQRPLPGACARYWSLPFIVEVSCRQKSNLFSSIQGVTPTNSSRTRTPASLNATPANINIAGEFWTLVHDPPFFPFSDLIPSLAADLTRAVNALPRNMTSQMFNAIAAVTAQGQNPNTTPAQWSSSQYGYGGSTGGGGSSSAYHVRNFYLHLFNSTMRVN